MAVLDNLKAAVSATRSRYSTRYSDPIETRYPGTPLTDLKLADAVELVALIEQLERQLKTAGEVSSMLKATEAMELKRAKEEIDKLTRALDACRWKPDEDCWCDVKATDQPGLHMPQCRKVRAILGIEAA